jgi:hypothetical protein
MKTNVRFHGRHCQTINETTPFSPLAIHSNRLYVIAQAADHVPNTRTRTYISAMAHTSSKRGSIYRPPLHARKTDSPSTGAVDVVTIEDSSKFLSMVSPSCCHF